MGKINEWMDKNNITELGKVAAAVVIMCTKSDKWINNTKYQQLNLDWSESLEVNQVKCCALHCTISFKYLMRAKSSKLACHVIVIVYIMILWSSLIER